MFSLLTIEILAGLVFLPVLLAFLWLGMSMLFLRYPSEQAVVRISKLAIGTAFVSAALMATLQPVGIGGEVLLGSWFGDANYHYDIVMETDLIAIAYALFSTILLYLISSFSERYLHKESGFQRFYLILLVFAFGLLTVSFAGTIEILLVGWEVVGLTSVMLIAFFNSRPQPPENGLWVFSIYRLTDIGLYAAVLYLHLISVNTEFHPLQDVVWAGIPFHEGAEITAMLLLLAVLGKSALFPFCNWLPRAMEGPTPSSAVFYGALSIHLGPLLLLRMADIISQSNLISSVLVVIGVMTAIFGNLIGRVQHDIKSRLAYGAVTQLGFIVIEIGFGFFEVALLHVIAHAVFRTLQFLRAPSLLHERHHLEQMLGHHIGTDIPENIKPSAFKRLMFRFGMERGFLDVVIVDWCVYRLMFLIRAIDKVERRVGDFLSAAEVGDTEQASVGEKEDVLSST